MSRVYTTYFKRKWVPLPINTETIYGLKKLSKIFAEVTNKYIPLHMKTVLILFHIFMKFSKHIPVLIPLNSKQRTIDYINHKNKHKAAGLSLPTVNKSLARLKNLNIIRNSRRIIMLNPNFIAYGKYKTRSGLLEIYEKL